MSTAYPTAAIPEPFQILGLRLKPFCLGHFLHMERFEVAFVSKDYVNATLDDLILGVLICSMTFEEFREFMFEPDAEKQISDWGAACGTFDLTEKIRLFNDYVTKSSEQPVVVYEEEGTPSGAHWAEMLKLVLTGELGYTSSEALNLPLAQAFHEFYKNAENKGIVTLITEEDAKILEQAKEAQNGL